MVVEMEMATPPQIRCVEIVGAMGRRSEEEVRPNEPCLGSGRSGQWGVRDLEIQAEISGQNLVILEIHSQPNGGREDPVMGSRSVQSGPFEADLLYLDLSGQDGLCGKLVALRCYLFRNGESADLSCLDKGHASVPPGLS